MIFRIAIDLSNDAFQHDRYGEIARRLRELADRIDHRPSGFLQMPLRDSNGKTVGDARFTRS